MKLAVQTIVFDLDGTLYEDERVYDRYALELGLLLPEGQRARFLVDWTATKTGRAVARVGLGYDATQDRLFRFSANRIVSFIDWNGHEEPASLSVPDVTGKEAGEGQQPQAPATEVPIFGPDRFNIGDRWGLPDALAAHYGLPRAQRGAAFRATRAYMGSDAFQLRAEPRLRDLLLALNAAGKYLVAMTNSPAETTEDVLGQLGLRDCFALVAPASHKPLGLKSFLDGVQDSSSVLCVGDNYVNDIEPALQAGSHALYIDRFKTHVGLAAPRCHGVPSIQAAIDWLRERCSGHTIDLA